ncbi:hypothetical protein [Deinococcus sp. QL22]|uniref:hypothetical protein n=1 Tax=Deinococcus sp. QL22 TaxID=2939437 RepID=UPI002016C1BD|nr:hypothetical protein [Deinococcus sp. QL22]UQN10222.1 hypothetical protein M1R55_27995 [Deinococcus sp. QL22]
MMRKIILSQADFDTIFKPESRSPELEANRVQTLARATELGQKLGPLTTERLRAGIPFPLPSLTRPD